MINIESLHGVGPERARSFAKKGIRTAEDLLYYLPRGHEDRTRFFEIADCPVGEFVCVKAKVYSPVRETRIKKNFNIYSMIIFDDSGAINVVWYNNKFVKNAFKTGEEVLFYGKLGISRGKKELLNPIYEKADKEKYIGKIVPVYPLFGNITQKVIAGLVQQAMEKCGELSEYLPKSVREKYEICNIDFAMKNIHFPEDFNSYTKARKRFVFEELLFLQLALLGRRKENALKKRTPFSNTKCVEEFTNSLAFELTAAQKRVIGEIIESFKAETPMNRLVQGDVGSGKTVVAAAGMYVAAKNGYQSAIMAPTEILANQHFNTFSEFFKNTDIKCVLLTSGTKDKKTVYEKIKNGDYDVIIGTNAIIQKDVEYKNLGFVVADEQHRFGVSQRARLTAKGEDAHTLIMTATPIPRTLSLILYGDLDVSIIDELPPGRKPVKTYAVGEDMRKRIYAFLDKHIKNGSQAYVVCPLIEESEKTDLANAEDVYKKLKSIFPQYAVGLVHGKMRACEKDEIMQAFVKNKIQILVSTTVIEVGVNVPNSNIMVIENAERFGLSTLHQLRGRVGRGQDEAFCVMFTKSESDITKKRMETLCKSNDGFYISEQDLKLRGPGDFFGTRQHGLPELKVANLFTDANILESAQKAAKDILNSVLLITETEKEKLVNKVDKMLSDEIVLN